MHSCMHATWHCWPSLTGRPCHRPRPPAPSVRELLGPQWSHRRISSSSPCSAAAVSARCTGTVRASPPAPLTDNGAASHSPLPSVPSRAERAGLTDTRLVSCRSGIQESAIDLIHVAVCIDLHLPRAEEMSAKVESITGETCAAFSSLAEALASGVSFDAVDIM